MKKLMVALMAASALAVGCGEKGSGAAAREKVGVPECDDYIAKMEACFNKDAAAKAALESGLSTTRDAWKQTAAQGGAAKDGLKTVCASMVVQIPANCK